MNTKKNIEYIDNSKDLFSKNKSLGKRFEELRNSPISHIEIIKKFCVLGKNKGQGHFLESHRDSNFILGLMESPYKLIQATEEKRTQLATNWIS